MVGLGIALVVIGSIFLLFWYWLLSARFKYEGLLKIRTIAKVESEGKYKGNIEVAVNRAIQVFTRVVGFLLLINVGLIVVGSLLITGII